MTDAAKAKGASSDEFYSNLTEAVHTGMFDQSTDEFYQSRGIPQRNRDFLNRQDQEGVIIGSSLTHLPKYRTKIVEQI